LVGLGRGDPEAAHQIGGAVDSDETAIERVGEGEVVDQHHRPGAFATHVETDGRALPEDAALAGVAGKQLAFSVAQAAKKGAGGFLAENVAVRLAPTLN